MAATPNEAKAKRKKRVRLLILVALLGASILGADHIQLFMARQAPALAAVELAPLSVAGKLSMPAEISALSPDASNRTEAASDGSSISRSTVASTTAPTAPHLSWPVAASKLAAVTPPVEQSGVESVHQSLSAAVVPPELPNGASGADAMGLLQARPSAATQPDRYKIVQPQKGDLPAIRCVAGCYN